jgi:FkbM family methyltransferase
MYSQNNEEELLLDYFNCADSNAMHLLDIGANDGTTFSNSARLIELGWNATLLEPSPIAFDKLKKHYEANDRVRCLNYGISALGGKSLFYESGGYQNGGDVALYSTIDKNEMKRWEGNVDFKEIEAEFVTYQKFCEDHQGFRFDFISIDIEGYDWMLLQQMDLNALGCQMLIIEWNGNIDQGNKMIAHCKNYGLRELSRNAENLIFVR